MFQYLIFMGKKIEHQMLIDLFPPPNYNNMKIYILIIIFLLMQSTKLLKIE